MRWRSFRPRVSSGCPTSIDPKGAQNNRLAWRPPRGNFRPNTRDDQGTTGRMTHQYRRTHLGRGFCAGHLRRLAQAGRRGAERRAVREAGRQDLRWVEDRPDLSPRARRRAGRRPRRRRALADHAADRSSRCEGGQRTGAARSRERRDRADAGVRGRQRRPWVRAGSNGGSRRKGSRRHLSRRRHRHRASDRSAVADGRHSPRRIHQAQRHRPRRLRYPLRSRPARRLRGVGLQSL